MDVTGLPLISTRDLPNSGKVNVIKVSIANFAIATFLPFLVRAHYRKNRVRGGEGRLSKPVLSSNDRSSE